MRGRRRAIVRLLVLLLAAWVVLDFGLTVEGAFAFNVDESLVGIRSADGPTVPAPGVFAASLSYTVRNSEVARRPRSPRPVVWSPPQHLVPRSRLFAAADHAGGSDDH